MASAEVMDGIQTSSVPFVSAFDNEHFSSTNLDGAGTRLIKRTREAMNHMAEEYEKQTRDLENSSSKRQKRTAETKGFINSTGAEAVPIRGTRSPQGVAVVTAKLVVQGDTISGKTTGKMIIPPHSVVYAKRDKEPKVIQAVADTTNFQSQPMAEQLYVPIGVSLENALDATKFQMEHESRRYFAVAVEGVVSVQCPKDMSEKFSYGEPVYLDPVNGFNLSFYNTQHLQMDKSNKNFFRLGFFVEQIDKKNGGIRVKLAIKKSANLQSNEDRLSDLKFIETPFAELESSFETMLENLRTKVERTYTKQPDALNVEPFVTSHLDRSSFDKVFNDISSAFANFKLDDSVITGYKSMLDTFTTIEIKRLKIEYEDKIKENIAKLSTPSGAVPASSASPKTNFKEKAEKLKPDIENLKQQVESFFLNVLEQLKLKKISTKESLRSGFDKLKKSMLDQLDLLINSIDSIDTQADFDRFINTLKDYNRQISSLRHNQTLQRSIEALPFYDEFISNEDKKQLNEINSELKTKIKSQSDPQNKKFSQDLENLTNSISTTTTKKGFLFLQLYDYLSLKPKKTSAQAVQAAQNSLRTLLDNLIASGNNNTSA